MLRRILFGTTVLLTIVLAIGQGNSNEVKLVEGENAKQGEFPYMIAVNPTSFNFSYCGGALALVEDVQVVLTSAQCARTFTVPDFELSKTRLVAGDINLDYREHSGREQIRQIRTVDMHPLYEPITKTNDIAVLTMDSNFDLNQDVNPIALPEQGQNTTGDVIVTGFGGNDTMWMYPVLMKVQLSLMDPTKCEKIYKNTELSVEKKGKLCANINDTDGPYHCTGDLGGPAQAVKGGYLVGIVIHSEKCQENGPALPDVYTDVAHHVDWIKQVARTRSSSIRITHNFQLYFFILVFLKCIY